jgi:hypothetical protein
MALRMVTCDIPIERETLQVYFVYLINSLCVSGLTGAALKRSTLSSEEPVRPARFAIHRHASRWNFSYRYFMLFFTGGSFPNLVRKRRCTVTIDCVWAYSSTKNAFSARVAIFTQHAPLAASDITKHPRHVQTNLESFSLYRYVTCYHPLRPSNVPIFCNE